MIQLSAAAQALQFANLKTPPTHAALVSRLIANGVGGAHDVTGLTLNYWFGSLDASGAFAVDPTLPTVVVTIPTPETIATFGMPTISNVLSNLFDGGVVPSAEDPLVSTPVPSKKAGDAKISDLDFVAMYFEPRLAGTVVVL